MNIPSSNQSFVPSLACRVAERACVDRTSLRVVDISESLALRSSAAPMSRREMAVLRRLRSRRVTVHRRPSTMSSLARRVAVVARVHRQRVAARRSSARANATSATKSSENEVILVTGATGRVGKEVIARLRAIPGFTVRAATRDKDAYAKALGAHETTRFDLEDEKTWGPAMEGATRLFSSTQDKYIERHMAFAKWCGRTPEVRNNLKHIVRISCFGADTNTNAYDANAHVSRDNAGIPLMLQHYWWSEECFIDSGFKDRLTSIRGRFYMNHLLKNELESIKSKGTFTSPLGECKNSFVSCNDMAEAAVRCLVEGPERHGDKYYDICGAQSTSMHEVANILTKALATDEAKDVCPEAYGKRITYVPQDIEQFEKDFGSTRAEFFEYLRNGFYSRCSPDFYNITGKRPLTYYEYLTTKGAAGDTGLAELFSSQGAIFTKGVDQFKDLKNITK